MARVRILYFSTLAGAIAAAVASVAAAQADEAAAQCRTPVLRAFKDVEVHATVALVNALSGGWSS